MMCTIFIRLKLQAYRYIFSQSSKKSNAMPFSALPNDSSYNYQNSEQKVLDRAFERRLAQDI